MAGPVAETLAGRTRWASGGSARGSTEGTRSGRSSGAATAVCSTGSATSAGTPTSRCGGCAPERFARRRPGGGSSPRRGPGWRWGRIRTWSAATTRAPSTESPRCSPSTWTAAPSVSGSPTAACTRALPPRCGPACSTSRSRPPGAWRTPTRPTRSTRPSDRATSCSTRRAPRNSPTSASPRPWRRTCRKPSTGGEAPTSAPHRNSAGESAPTRAATCGASRRACC